MVLLGDSFIADGSSLQADGHRPMSELFRETCDEMLLGALDELHIPYVVIGGTIPERLEAIVSQYHCLSFRSADKAIALASEEEAKID